MDLDKLLDTLDAAQREALLDRLLEEAAPDAPTGGPTSGPTGDVASRLRRLERAVFGPEAGRPDRPQGMGPPGGMPDFMPMMRRMMAGMGQSPPASRQTTQAARTFNALADETRLKIVRLLAGGEKHVEELVQALGVAQSTTSHHLKVLKEAGLVRGEKRGRSVYYTLTESLDPEEVDGV